MCILTLAVRQGSVHSGTARLPQMRSRFRPILLLVASLVFGGALAGCNLGGQTGSEGIDENPSEAGDLTTTPENGVADCTPVQEQELDLDQVSDLGFSADQVLGWAKGAHAASLEWNQDPGLVVFGPETGLSSITVELEATGTTALYVVPPPEACGRPRLGMAVSVSVSTESGALDEQFDVKLWASAEQEASLQAELDLGSLNGSFFVDLPEGQTASALYLDVALSPSSFAGSLWSSIEQSDTSGVSSASLMTFARWPAP